MRNTSIRVPLILALVLAVVVPAVIVNIQSGISGLLIAQEQADDQLAVSVTLKTDQIDNWIMDRRTQIEQTLTESEELPPLAWLLPDESMQSLRDDTARRVRDVLRSTIRLTRQFDLLFVTDPAGTVLASSDFSMDGESLADWPYYQIERTNRYIQPPQDGSTDVYFFEPIFQTGDEAPTVILVGRTDLRSLTPLMIERTGLGETGETYLVGPDRHLLTPARFEGYTVGETLVDTKAVRVALETQAGGSDTHRDYRGEPVRGVYAYLSELHVVLVAEKDVREINQGIVDTVLGNVAWTVVAVIVAVVVGVLFINRRIVQRLALISTKAGQVAAGDLDVSFTSRSSDEIGQLAVSLQTMTEKLRSRIGAEQSARHELEATVTDYVAFIQRVSQGDLTEKLDLSASNTRDGDLYVLGVSLNRMVERLREMAQQFREMSAAVTSAASQIQAASTEQMASATEQEVAVTQTVATVEEVRATVNQTAERAETVAISSQQSVSVSRLGQDAVDDTYTGMAQIRDRVGEIAQNILMLSERSQQIGEIISTVNALADRSNMLALNASIEAARAGDQGKGFAVVAMEVRQLAEQSRDATARVQVILDEILDATNATVLVTEEGNKEAESGLTMVRRTGEAIRELAQTLGDAAQAANQIAASTQQQTNGIDQLGQAMRQIKEATTQAAISARQTEASVRDLIEMARKLEAAADQYRL